MNLYEFSKNTLKEILNKSYIDTLKDINAIYSLCGSTMVEYEDNGIFYLPVNEENIIRYVENATLLEICIDNKLIPSFENPYHLPIFSVQELDKTKEEFLNAKYFSKYRKKLIKNKRYFLESFPYGIKDISAKDIPNAISDHQKIPYDSYPKNKKINFYLYGNNITNYNIKLDSDLYIKEKALGGNETNILKNTFFGNRLKLIGLREAFFAINKAIIAQDNAYKAIVNAQKDNNYKELYKKTDDYIARILYTLPGITKKYKKLIDLEDGKLGKLILSQSYDCDFLPWDTFDEFVNKYSFIKKRMDYKQKNISEAESECGINYKNDDLTQIINKIDAILEDNKTNIDIKGNNVFQYININEIDAALTEMYMKATIAYSEYDRRVKEEKKKGQDYTPLKNWKTSTYFSKANNNEEARIIFKTLAKQYHPDVTGDDKKFMEIKEEYESILNQ